MDITLSSEADESEMIEALHKCGVDDAVCCRNERSFKQAKLLLVKEKLKNVTIQLLDSDGYAIRQVTSKPRKKNSDQLNVRQRAVVSALEKVLLHCKKEGVQLVGYSDELVALPGHISLDDISSSGALDVNCHGVYKGADAILPETK